MEQRVQNGLDSNIYQKTASEFRPTVSAYSAFWQLVFDHALTIFLRHFTVYISTNCSLLQLIYDNGTTLLVYFDSRLLYQCVWDPVCAFEQRVTVRHKHDGFGTTVTPAFSAFR